MNIGPHGPYTERSARKSALPGGNLYTPPFRCGFQPQGKPYAEYVAHLENCNHHDCIDRYERRDAMRMYFVRKYGMLKTNAPPYAPSPDSHAPLASATARSRCDNSGAH